MTFRFLIAAFALPLAASLSACSSCSGDDASGPDGGTDTNSDTNSDTNTDTGTGTDTDADSDTGTDTDTDTMPEGFAADAGPWVWEDLPDAGDCGVEGCRQLTFTDEVRQLEWDVWGNLIAFNDGEIDDSRIRIIDFQESKQLSVPSPFNTETLRAVFYPATIYEQTVCYAETAYYLDGQSTIICADLQNHTQQPVFSRSKEGTDFPTAAHYIDVYGSRIVSMGGCGEVMDSWPLCAFDMEAPGTYQEIAPSYYGYYNQIWGDVAVWASESYDDYDIRGYDFSTGEFIEITDDTKAQMNPRIHGTRVVYHDLKLGNSLPAGDWNHAAVFLYDLVTEETTQITSGEWIASDPDIHENIVVWADSRACSDPNDKNDLENVEIWGYNLDTGTEFQITDLPGRAKTTPRIWGDKVFVHMYKAAGGNAIYMFDLPAAAGPIGK